MVNASVAQPTDSAENLKSNEKKWTKPLMSLGWTALPSILLDKQPALGIDSLDLNILLQLMKYWWKKDELPYPSKETLAELVGVKASTIRKRIQRMENEGLILRIGRHDKAHGGQQSNFYSFDGLIQKLHPFAEEERAMRQEQQKEKTRVRRRKKPQAKSASPKLKILNGGKQS